jgi:pyruvate/2-oxoglutarate dehydrogenase complex dihydrolipoamide acyltransferase (E2) component
MLASVGVAVSLDSTIVDAEPGAETAFDIRVENTGMVVDAILLDVLGDAREWARAEPAQLNLLPGTGEQARIVFCPPRSASLPAGEVPFAIRAMSSEDTAGSAIEEGVVRVRAFTDLVAELVPKNASGRRMARQRLIVENRGNEPDEVTISAEDPDAALSFRIKPRAATVLPGTAMFVRFLPVPRKRFLKGTSKTLAFQAYVLPTKSEPVTANGAMLQRQMMPEWLLPVLAVAAVVATAAVALWFTLLKPTIKSAATQAVAQQTQQLAASAQKADNAADQASQAAKDAVSVAGAALGGSQKHAAAAATKKPAAGKKSKATSSAKASANKTAGATASPSATASAGGASPVSGFLQANASPGSAYATYAYPIAKGGTLNVSDIVLENPMGDSGVLQIRAGSQTLFEFGLADFRDLDYHFVQALQFTSAAPLTLAVQCADTGGKHCTAALSFSGTLAK